MLSYKLYGNINDIDNCFQLGLHKYQRGGNNVCNSYLDAYMKRIEGFNDKDFLLSTIIYSISPTLAGVKVSSLVNFNKIKNRNLYDIWEKYKEDVIKTLKVDYFELKKTKDMCVVIFYNKYKLKYILLNKKNQRFLEKFNYKNFDSTTECLEKLKSRYENLCPHEIGIFLGYPLKDVIDFVECPNKKCLLLGYWKVYNDIKNAEIKFSKYDSIKDKVINLIAQGNTPKDILKCI